MIFDKLKYILVAISLLVLPNLVYGQYAFTLEGQRIQIHSFLQQGFAYSNQNNYLTMDTSKGTFALTDGGVNASISIKNRFRLGAQVYARNIGRLGEGHPEVDWAYGDYKFTNWLGVRAGKVKTMLGLYNDTQDAEFLYTWAILPQSVYPLDLRSNSIAHAGVDIYGDIPIRRFGKLSYTGYVGARTLDRRGGVAYWSKDFGIPVTSMTGRSQGADIRWHTPLEGLMGGFSFMDQTQDRKGTYAGMGMEGMSYQIYANPQRTLAGYFDLTRGRWHFAGELRRSNYLCDISTVGQEGSFVWDGTEKMWFISGAFRVSKYLELGSYYSWYKMYHPTDAVSPAANHVYDKTVTARIDITKFWNLKVEGHFMDGYGDTFSAHGFYSTWNPSGFKPTTNMLVIRTGVTF
jgi:hypothetical protein